MGLFGKLITFQHVLIIIIMSWLTASAYHTHVFHCDDAFRAIREMKKLVENRFTRQAMYVQTL